MDVSKYYAISLGGVLLLVAICHKLGIYGPNIVHYISSYFIYPLVIQRRYWSSITRAQALLLVTYVISNCVFMGIEIKSSKDIMLRAGIMATINLLPLFLGGRTSSLADQLMGISLHSYYIAHHWIGRVAVVQGVLHGALALTSSKVFNMRAVSGIVSASSLALLLLNSLYMFRIQMYEIFLGAHLLLAITSMGSLLWHLIPGTPTEIFIPAFALALWIGNVFWQLRRRVRVEKARNWIYSGDRGVAALKLTVTPKQPIVISPGQYFYLRHRFYSHPSVIMWWDVSSSTNNANATPTSLEIKANTLTFLIPPQNRSFFWSNLLTNINPSRLVLDGPYGQNLHLECYETVILVAQGIGIGGVLSYVRHLTYWKYHNDVSLRRRILTRKLDLYWILEDNSDEHWIGDYLAEMQARDEAQALLQVWCYYPQKKNSEPPIHNTNTFKCIYPNSIEHIAVPTAIREASRRTPGKSIVIACGRASFTKYIRDDVRHITSTECVIKFEEVEYRPRDSKASPFERKTWPHNNERSKYLIEDRETMLKDLCPAQRPKQINTKEQSQLGLVWGAGKTMLKNQDSVRHPERVYQRRLVVDDEEEAVNYIEVNAQNFV